MATKSPKTLDGIRVLEFGSYISGPFAGALLCDLGAEVIKVESPPGGDPFRAWGSPGGPPANFSAYNAGKASVCLDIRSESQWLDLMASTSDVVLSNFRPSAQRRLGLTYDQLKTVNPRLVVCNISGFGPTGPLADKPCYDGVAQAMSGLMALLTPQKAPQCVGPAFSDAIAGLHACLAILAALIERCRTGFGRGVDVSMVGSSMSFIRDAIGRELLQHEENGPLSRAHSSQSYAFVGSDGAPFVVHLSSPPKFWDGLVAAAGRPELRDDERFRTRQDRVLHYEELHQEFQAVFAKNTSIHWLDVLEANDVPSGPLRTPAQAVLGGQAMDEQGTIGERELLEIAKAQWLAGLSIDEHRNAPDLAADNERFGLSPYKALLKEKR